MINVVIVGVGELVQQVPEDLNAAFSPLDLMERAARMALKDTGAKSLASEIDTLAVVRTFSDSGAPLKSPFGDAVNPPRSIAKRLDIDPETAVYSELGGHTPQAFVNEFATKIASGLSSIVLLVGAEALANQKALRRAKYKADWSDDIDGQIDNRLGNSLTDTVDIEQVPNEFTNIPSIYSVFENARRARLNQSRAEYGNDCADLFARFSQVAAGHPCSMFPESSSTKEVKSISEKNTPVTDIYPRAMVAKDGVNQGASLIMMSEDKAREMGIAADKWIYPVAGSEASDLTIAHREDISSSIAMTVAYNAVFAAAGLTVDDMTCMDIYSCFPIAVFAACEAMGIQPDDPRGLTLTGGLPFFGGAGNNYSMHGIASMVDTLRGDPGSRGLVLANGGFLSKESAGIYSTQRPDTFAPIDSSAAQTLIDAEPDVEQASAPSKGQIEAYSVLYQRGAPLFAYAFMRTGAQRFLARTATNDTAAVERFLANDPLGEEFAVHSSAKRNDLIT